MQLEHSFSVPVGVDEAWRILTDVQRISPCFPGTKLTSVDGDEFAGSLKVKLGPVNLTYKGSAAFREKDEAGRRAVIAAQGKDSRGGTATATVTATLAEDGESTRVDVVTDLELTGKPAQFGRNVMEDVGNRLLGQFADCLAATLKGEDDDASAAEAGPSATEADEPAATPAEAFAAPEEPVSAVAGSAAPDQPAEQPVDQPVAPPVKRNRPKPPPKRPAAPQQEPAEIAAEIPPAPAEPVSEPRQKLPVEAEAEAAAAPRVEPSPAAEERVPAYAGASGIAVGTVEELPRLASVNGHGGLTETGPHADSAALLPQAGPAVAKRLAPVAVALVVVLMAVRRHRKG